MANRTIAERITELEADRTRVRTALATLQAGVQSTTVDGMTVSRFQLKDLRADLTRIEKSLQRLYRGGRGMVLDMSYGGSTTCSDCGATCTDS